MKLRRGVRGFGFGLLTGLIGLGGVAVPGAAGASEAGGPGIGFRATARAQGLRMTIGSPSFLIVEDYIDGGGPIAEAVFDSVGTAQAFGSVPYPGDTAVAFPGTAAGLGAPRLPDYPFYAKAEYPVTPESQVSDPSGQFAMQASSSATASSGAAHALFGSPESVLSGAASEATAKTAEDGTVTARAVNEVRMLSFGGGALTINAVRSESVTTLRPESSEPTSEAALSVTGGSVAGQAVVFGPDGARSPGGPLPGSNPEQMKSLNDVLANAGISVAVVKSDKVAGGQSADVLRVTVLKGAPIDGTPKGKIVFDFGGATSSVNVGTATSAPSGNAAAGPPAAGSSTAGKVAVRPGVNAAGQASGMTRPSTTSNRPASVVRPGGDPAQAPASVTVTGNGELPQPAEVAAVPIAANRPVDRTDTLVPVLALAAVGLVLGAVWRRREGVRG